MMDAAELTVHCNEVTRHHFSDPPRPGAH